MSSTGRLSPAKTNKAEKIKSSSRPSKVEHNEQGEIGQYSRSESSSPGSGGSRTPSPVKKRTTALTPIKEIKKSGQRSIDEEIPETFTTSNDDSKSAPHMDTSPTELPEGLPELLPVENESAAQRREAQPESCLESCCTWFPFGAPMKTQCKAIINKTLQVGCTLGAMITTGYSVYNFTKEVSSIKLDLEDSNIIAITTGSVLGSIMGKLTWAGIGQGIHYIEFFGPAVTSLSLKVRGAHITIENFKTTIKGSLDDFIKKSDTEIKSIKSKVNGIGKTLSTVNFIQNQLSRKVETLEKKIEDLQEEKIKQAKQIEVLQREKNKQAKQIEDLQSQMASLFSANGISMPREYKSRIGTPHRLFDSTNTIMVTPPTSPDLSSQSDALSPQSTVSRSSSSTDLSDLQPSTRSLSTLNK